MALSPIWIWKKIPFLRLLAPLIIGIILQWYWQLPTALGWILFTVSLLTSLVYFLLPVINKFQFSSIGGLSVSLLFFSIGAILTWQKDIRNNKNWIGHHYQLKDAILVTLDEPLVEKTKSYKATASISCLFNNGRKQIVQGKVILYFKKDSTLQKLSYGSQLLFKKNLQEIKNAGNPGGFDYKRYTIFQGITHQVYLQPHEFEILPVKNSNQLNSFIYETREKIISIIQKYIPGEKEQGLAKALLIGYKNDLDQSLVQSYTNTGVVHIIAISGLHLGLIYWILVQLLKPMRRIQKLKWLRPILIITGLWVFSFLAGAQPSVLRSALMFSCIVAGESFSKKTSIYNTLAVSAFLLLCFNPFWLWDVGFQLSYAAVLSIIIFMRPIYNWFYIKNKILDFIWKLNAVTLSAQIFTLPIGIYHFHQFPASFIITNFIAVPSSSVILIGLIALCSISYFSLAAIIIGKTLAIIIGFMNSYIENVELLPFTLLDGLQISISQAIFMLMAASGISYWMLERSKISLKLGLLALLFFSIERMYSFLLADNQKKIIVYNIPQKRAIDIIDGRKYHFIGDSDLVIDGFVRNFHLKPSRILHRLTVEPSSLHLDPNKKYFNYRGRHIVLLEQPVGIPNSIEKPIIDLLVISKNHKLSIRAIAGSAKIKQIVFDGTVPFWKIPVWSKDCDSLQIPWHDVSTKGAFVMNLN